MLIFVFVYCIHLYCNTDTNAYTLYVIYNIIEILNLLTNDRYTC